MNNDTIRLESISYRAADLKRLRVHSDGKVKTSLNVLAKGHLTYKDKHVEAIISDVKLFNQLTERRIDKHFEYTQKLLTIRNLERSVLTAPCVSALVMERVTDLLSAVLAFKGKTLEVVRRELALINQAYQHETAATQYKKRNKHITYNVNTKVTWGEISFMIGKITIKKTFKDGIFFASETCTDVKRKLQAARMTKDGQINTFD